MNMNTRAWTWIVILGVAITITIGCHKNAMTISYRELSHSSREILVVGLTHDQVQDLFGSPLEKRTKDFRLPKYRLPKELPKADEQWIYVGKDQMSVRLVFFRQGNVVLALEEWSDF